MYNKIYDLKYVQNIGHFSAVHLSHKDGNNYLIREYSGTDIVSPSQPHAILVPSENHIIKSDINDVFGIDEMSINENFVIWQSETEKH